MTVFARYPRSIYSGSVSGEIMRFGFSYVIPILLIVTVPARVLLEKALEPSWLIAVAVAAAVGGVVVSRAIFQWSLMSYRSCEFVDPLFVRRWYQRRQFRASSAECDSENVAVGQFNEIGMGVLLACPEWVSLLACPEWVSLLACPAVHRSATSNSHDPWIKSTASPHVSLRDGDVVFAAGWVGEN